MAEPTTVHPWMHARRLGRRRKRTGLPEKETNTLRLRTFCAPLRVQSDTCTRPHSHQGSDFVAAPNAHGHARGQACGMCTLPPTAMGRASARHPDNNGGVRLRVAHTANTARRTKANLWSARSPLQLVPSRQASTSHTHTHNSSILYKCLRTGSSSMFQRPRGGACFELRMPRPKPGSGRNYPICAQSPQGARGQQASGAQTRNTEGNEEEMRRG